MKERSNPPPPDHLHTRTLPPPPPHQTPSVHSPIAASCSISISKKLDPRRRWMNRSEMAAVKDVNPHDFVKAYSAHLKLSGKVELPQWVDVVKTAKFKELPPKDPDWYYIRAASMARKIYLRKGIGAGGFKKIYGGRKRNGACPPHFCKSSGAVSRNILQQLKNMGIVDVDPKGGRLLTSKGRSELDQVARRIAVVQE